MTRLSGLISIASLQFLRGVIANPSTFQYPLQAITGEHLALINSSWRAPKHDSRFPGNRVYRFDVILAGDPTVLGRIEKVVYLLPPAWGATSPIEVDSKTPLFGLKQLAWSDLLVRARIYVQQQFEPIYLSSFVRLTDHGTRLVTL